MFRWNRKPFSFHLAFRNENVNGPDMTQRATKIHFLFAISFAEDNFALHSQLQYLPHICVWRENESEMSVCIHRRANSMIQYAERHQMTSTWTYIYLLLILWHVSSCNRYFQIPDNNNNIFRCCCCSMVQIYPFHGYRIYANACLGVSERPRQTDEMYITASHSLFTYWIVISIFIFFFFLFTSMTMIQIRITHTNN